MVDLREDIEDVRSINYDGLVDNILNIYRGIFTEINIKEYCVFVFKFSFFFDIPFLLFFHQIKEMELLLFFLSIRISISLWSYELYKQFRIHNESNIIYYKFMIDMCIVYCMSYYSRDRYQFFSKNHSECFLPLLVICLYNVFVDCIFMFVRQCQMIYYCNFCSLMDDEECMECRCNICFESYNKKEIYQLICQHRFHTYCIQQWINFKHHCPVCRRYII